LGASTPPVNNSWLANFAPQMVRGEILRQHNKRVGHKEIKSKSAGQLPLTRGHGFFTNNELEKLKIIGARKRGERGGTCNMSAVSRDVQGRLKHF